MLPEGYADCGGDNRHAKIDDPKSLFESLSVALEALRILKACKSITFDAPGDAGAIEGEEVVAMRTGGQRNPEEWDTIHPGHQVTDGFGGNRLDAIRRAYRVSKGEDT